MRRIPFSRLSSLILCVALAGCGYFIPPEKSVPRYNGVVGEPRRPELNPASGAAAASSPAASAAAAYPPVSDETRARADAVVANDLPPPVVAPAANQPLARHVPEENATANTNYPPLTSVPPGPTTTDPEAVARLARVRAQLEQERAQAGYDKTQLAHDAAAEPSLAPADSITATPIAPPSYTASPSTTPKPLLPPPLPLRPASANMPAPTAQEPIVLRPPQASSYAAAPSYASPSTAVSDQPMPAPAAGGFNPLEGAGAVDNGSVYGGSSYLPPSRYAGRGY